MANKMEGKFHLVRKGVTALNKSVKSITEIGGSAANGNPPLLPASMTMDESELLGDTKYRNYVTAVERALRAFEYSSEWADLISALGKLNKVLQTNSRYRIIPKRLLIGKRLAQCTHPALPSGVHLKALETYDLIFRFIGPKLLCQDMFIYSAGLFPLLGNASMSVKPVLLNLYEEHYLPLGEHLKPALTGLLQGILPGLEEGSDFYDRTNTLLEQLCAGMVKSNFYGALWECVLSSPVVRLPAITFILSQFDRKLPIADQKYFLGNNKSVMVQAVCAALNDVVVLVQRCVLDLIMICFPIHNAGVSPEELQQLLTASLSVLLRRDMSLNRRLYSWLLGNEHAKKMQSAPAPPPIPSSTMDKPEMSHRRTDSVLTNDSLVSNEDEGSEYFEMYSRALLIQALKKWLHDPPIDPYNVESKQRFLKPYRLLISLLDKHEVSSPIIDEVLVEVYIALFNHCTKPKAQLQPDNSVATPPDADAGFSQREILQGAERPVELIKTANLLFNSFEPYFMWDYVARKFELCCQQSVLRSTGQVIVSNNASIKELTCSKLCMLVNFLLDIVALETYPETPTEYLPQLMCKIIMTLTNYCSYLDLNDVHHALGLCQKLLTKVQPSMVTSPEPHVPILPTSGMAQDEELPLTLLKQLEGIENGYDVIENFQSHGGQASAATSSSMPRQDSGASTEEEKSSEKAAAEKKRSSIVEESEPPQEEGEETDESSRLIEGGEDSDEDSGAVQSLDRLASQPQKFSEANVPPTRPRRPNSLGSFRQDSSSMLDEILEGPDSPEKATERKPPAPSITSIADSDKDGPPVFLMQACVQCFQTFFAKLITKKILPNADIVKTCLAKVQVGEVVSSPVKASSKEAETDGDHKEDDEEEEKKRKKVAKGKEELSWKHCHRDLLEDGKTRTDSALTSDRAARTYLGDVTIECPSSKVLCQAYSTACNLLVEFACFPMYCNETISASLLKAPKVKGSVLGLPDWLQNLITCCCFVQDFDVQATSVSTVLELIALTKSVSASSDTKLVLPNPPNSPRSESGTISVVLIPAISSKHLECLNYSSNFFQRMAVCLWSHLSPHTPERHARSADLLHKLHNATPDAFICEDIIGNSLVQSRTSVSLEAHTKFALLWHLIRSQIRSSSPASKIRTFDRSLLVVLDSLEHPSSMIRSTTQSWLLEAINRGDIARLLEPILLVLLHPATSRVSVQFLGADALRRKQMEEELREREQHLDSIENRIYSISNVDGEIKYYVLKDGQQKFVMNATKQDPVFACTSVDEKMNVVTRSNLGLRFSQPSDYHHKPLSVTINPMSMSVHASFSDSDSEASVPSVKESGGSAERRRSNELGVSERLKPSSSTKGKVVGNKKQDSGSESATPIRGSGDGSTDDLSVSDGYEEPSYVYNEEVDESVEDAVRSILYAIVDKVVQDIDEKEVDESMPQIPEREPPASTVPSSAGPVHQTKPMVRPKSVPTLPTSPVKGAEEFLLDDLEGAMSGMETEPTSDSEITWKYPQEYSYAFDEKRIRLLPESKLTSLHPLQQHILLYVQVYDEEQILHVLTRLKSILHTCARQFVCAMSSTNISSTNTPQLIKLQQLLARHKRCITGWDFYTELEQEALLSFRSTTYLEVLILTCVYFMRSYYPQEGRASEEDALGNRDVQTASMEVLQHVLHELVDVVKNSGRGLATFISDLLVRCKVQKAVVYCLLASVYGARKSKSSLVEKDKAIIQDASPVLSNDGAQTFQIQLLKLVSTIIILEDHLFALCDSSMESTATLDSEWEYRHLKFQSQNSAMGFLKAERLSCQGLLLTAVLSALKQQHNAVMHRHWIALMTDSLPYLERGLPKLVIPLTTQLCRNLETLTGLYKMEEKNRSSLKDDVPPDHVITMLEGLTNICHFCLLESTSNLSSMTTRHTPSSPVNESESTPTTQIFSTLIGAFSRDKSKGSATPTSGPSSSPKAEARKGLLGMLPRIISSIARLWSVVHKCEQVREEQEKTTDTPTFSMGTPKAVRQQILELLSPIALLHSTNLLAAVGVVWSDSRKRHKPTKGKVLAQPSDEQLVLVQLVSAIKALPTDTLVQTIKLVLKTPPFTIRDKNQPGLEVSMLQFLYAHVQKMAVGPLRDSWPSILGLLKDGLQLNLSAPGQFLLLGILNEIVHKLLPFEERKDQRDLQEISQRLLEACNTIAGSSLEQTTWLRRNVSVKINAAHEQMVSESEADASDSAAGLESATEGAEKESSSAVTSTKSAATSTPPPQQSYSQYSVQALSLLAELLAPLLDMMYGSDEKDKVVPLLTSIMHNVTPYLKNHSALNMPSFRACTSLVSSLSDYQYTRKAWKRDAFELLVDSTFFQMDATCIGGWRCIIDNLMTHDRTTFKDLMTRVATLQNTSLSIFASKEQEMEQRAQLLKRLSFVVFCSERDQYVRSLPDIQERLAESLRLSQSPVVHEQVFTFFRVLLLRVSPHHLTGLWPTMITEMVQVFLHMEEQLSKTTDSSKKSAIVSFFNIGSNGGNPIKAFLSLYLSACKLLDLALCLPSESLPQFQVYKWAFVGESGQTDTQTRFVPHIARVGKLLKARKKQDTSLNQTALKRVSTGRPLLTMHHIRAVEELLPFFNTLSLMQQSSPASKPRTNGVLTSSTTADNRQNNGVPEGMANGITIMREGHESSVQSKMADDELIEHLVERDFLLIA
ncbi:protein DOP1A-like [Diadema antillarum]|uniref:protein DOP1A-like n=1 Tax=Diadema antillarum TaxID=105358 RepID=UPI003A835C59